MSKKAKVLKYVLMIIVIILLIGLIVYLFPVMKNISTPEGQMEFKNQVESMGALGYLALFGLQFAQIFLIVLPGEPIEILAGMCYGGFGGLIFITISVFIITNIIFFTVRKFGRKFVYSFCNQEQVKKIENSKIFQNPQKVEWIMLILFIIPGTPKDLLVYIAGLLPVKPLRFILISTFARFPSVISSSIAGENLINGNIGVAVFAYITTFAVVGFLIFIMRKLDKSNTTKEALEVFQKEEGAK